VSRVELAVASWGAGGAVRAADSPAALDGGRRDASGFVSAAPPAAAEDDGDDLAADGGRGWSVAGGRGDSRRSGSAEPRGPGSDAGVSVVANRGAIAVTCGVVVVTCGAVATLERSVIAGKLGDAPASWPAAQRTVFFNVFGFGTP